MPNLTDNDRQALQLADDLQKALGHWLGRSGLAQSCTVSPFVDSAGQPSVVIKMNAHVARAMIDSLQQQALFGSQPGPGGPATAQGLPLP
jgi:hypothetical protein